MISTRQALAATAAILGILLAANASATPSQIASAINDNARTEIAASINPQAAGLHDLGAVQKNLLFEHVNLVLRRSPQAATALAAFAKRQQTPGSADYHGWLTPKQFGEDFGPASADISKICAWLGHHGLTVNSVSVSGMTIDVSGTAAALRSAFGAEVHRLQARDAVHIANVARLSIPAALAQSVAGIMGLDDFRAAAYHTQARPRPESGFGAPGATFDAVGPQDFAVVYDLKRVWSSGITGAGKTIAIVGRSEIVQSDVDAFNAHFGVRRSGAVQTIHHSKSSCRDPGVTYDGDQVEASIDVEWTGAIAPSAKIVLAACASTLTTDGVDLSARQAVDLAPDVISVSFGACEQNLPVANQIYYFDLWSQAAVQGTTVSVATGDSGAASCSTDIYRASKGPGVSGLSSTPFNVAVGGTDFQDRVQSSEPAGTRNKTYWSNTNGAGAANALSYVPEMTWNDSCATPWLYRFAIAVQQPTSQADQVYQQCGNSFYRGYDSDPLYLLGGGGGGFSQIYTQPAWQQALYGMAPVGARQLPDISLFAASGLFGHALFFCSQSIGGFGTCSWDENSIDLGGGTSFAAPAFAGIMALVDQQKNGRQGNANYRLYELGLASFGPPAAQPAASLANCDANLGNKVDAGCVFHSVTTGSILQSCWTERFYYYDNNLNDAVDCYYGREVWAFRNNLLAYDWNGIMSFSGDKVHSFSPGYFSAALGYSVATGLGSPDVGNLVSAW